MAKIKAGILSKVSGKVAGVVGGTWKGTNYLRELVKPSNPNTPLQQAQRGKMAFVVASARQVVGDVLNPYLNKFCKTMSGYNWFCRENIKRLGGEPLAFASVPVLSFGTLGSGAIEADTLQSNEGIKLTAIPSVPAGHSLKFIYGFVDKNGNWYNLGVQESPAINTKYGRIDTIPLSGEQDIASVGFFADFDANGVLQAISASITEGFETITF